jgi:hypothetical protein
MSMFEHNNDYDRDYQNYLDWKIDQEKIEEECEEYLQRENEEVETTGERCVREAQEEEEERQLAQVTVGGVYRYELHWLPGTHEIRVEMENYFDGSSMCYWYPDTHGTTEVLSKLLSVPKEKIRITGLTFFTKEDMLVALEYEQRQFPNNMWRDYAEDGTMMQFNVEIGCPNRCYDASCNGTNCEFKQQHGIDGTQCDCSDCTLDYGLCSCGCAGNQQVHAEWVEERERELQAFIHETVEPETKPEPKPEIEEDTESVESAEDKENRLWSDFKLAMGAAFLALLMGMYICRTLGC